MPAGSLRVGVRVASSVLVVVAAVGGNVVSLTGDHHANFAGLLFADDFDVATPVYVATEYAVAGIASQSVFRAFAEVEGTGPYPFRT